jgi:hypothetical protein
LAYRLANKILGQIVKGITPKGEILVNSCWKLARSTRTNDPEKYEFTRAEIEEKLRWSRPTTNKFLKEGIIVGCIEAVEGKQGKEYKYRIVKEVSQVDGHLLTPEQLLKKLNGMTYKHIKTL